MIFVLQMIIPISIKLWHTIINWLVVIKDPLKILLFDKRAVIIKFIEYE